LLRSEDRKHNRSVRCGPAYSQGSSEEAAISKFVKSFYKPALRIAALPMPLSVERRDGPLDVSTVFPIPPDGQAASAVVSLLLLTAHWRSGTTRL
jgi:hypothetical protein